MICAIGDVHGCVRTLDKLINKIFAKYSVEEFIFLGDVVDRGEAVRETIELITDLSREKSVTVLEGNHEEMVMDFAVGMMKFDISAFYRHGGKETINSISYGNLADKIAAKKDVSKEFFSYYEQYKKFFHDLELYTSRIQGDEKFHFSHSGRGIGEEKYKVTGSREFKWSRNTGYRKTKYFGYIMVHGHTPIYSFDEHLDPKHPYVNRNKNGEICSINMDTGCVYGYSLSGIMINHDGQFEFIIQESLD